MSFLKNDELIRKTWIEYFKNMMMEKMSLEYRFRISEEEREIIINAIECCILNYYNKISNEKLKNCLKLLIKMITYDRKYRREFEQIIGVIIEKFNKRKIKEARRILRKLSKEYEELKGKDVLLYFLKIL
jgi:predicted ATPase